MSERVTCSSEGCDDPAVEVLWLRDLPGHVHDCARHAHDVREWCDVVLSRPIIDGRCSAVWCTVKPIATAMPTPLGGDA